MTLYVIEWLMDYFMYECKVSKSCGLDTYAVLLLLHFVDSAILEGPLENIGLVAGAGRDRLGLVEGGPELAKILQLDEMPDFGEGRLDDDALENGGGSWDRRHVVVVYRCGCLCV